MNEKYEERPVVGYEGLYVVSNTGKVFSLNYRHTGQKKERVGSKDGGGYHIIVLYRNGKPECVGIHRLVAAAFHDNPENKPCVDHIDGDPSNNHADNLRWVTYKENSNAPIAKKRMSKECSKFGASIEHVYPFIPKDELPLGRQGPISRTTFYRIMSNQSNGRYAQCRALFDQYKTKVE